MRRTSCLKVQLDSLQGDCTQAKWFEDFGIESVQEEHGVRILKTGKELPPSISNFVENPDIAQTFAVMCLPAYSIPFQRLETLKIKETDRIHALINELGKLGANLYNLNTQLARDGKLNEPQFNTLVSIDTYHDHRTARLLPR